MRGSVEKRRHSLLVAPATAELASLVAVATAELAAPVAVETAELAADEAPETASVAELTALETALLMSEVTPVSCRRRRGEALTAPRAAAKAMTVALENMLSGLACFERVVECRAVTVVFYAC